METDVRLKALARLARSQTEAAKSALLAELDEDSTVLKTQTEYEALVQSLEVMNVIGYRFADRAIGAIEEFIQTIGGRKLTYAQADDVFAEYIARYNNTESLIVKAVEVAVRLRYYETKAVLRVLLALHNHPSDSVRRKVLNGLDSLAKYDLDVFYGEDRKGGLGPAPQDAVLGALEVLDDHALKANNVAVIRLLTCILSPMLEGVSWTYKTATISRDTIPALPTVSDIRARSVRLLIRLYSLAENTRQRLAVIGALNGGTRTDPRGAADEKTRAMIANDTVEILDFFKQLVLTEDFEIVQKIESRSYWIYIHSLSEESKAAALTIEKAIADNKEYDIFRTLIGFEGVFGDWATYKGASLQFETTQQARQQKATDLARSITVDNFVEWRTRILNCAKTESDDLATFPVFYHFLGEFAAAQPALALKLVVEDAPEFARFLIPILRSLWDGTHRQQTRDLIEKWIREAPNGQEHYLFSAIKMFLSAEHLDVGLLKQLLHKATVIGDVPCVRQVAVVAVARWEDADEPVLTELLYPALGVLTAMNDASWIFDVWFRQEAKNLLAGIDPYGVEQVLSNLLVLDKIDFHAEDVLDSIAQKNPERILQFLIQRIGIDVLKKVTNSEVEFEAAPFEFHKLQESLSKIPRFAVRSVLNQYRADATLFAFRGGALLKNIFPDFSQEFEAELLELVREGGDSNLEFVLGVLRNYHGEIFIHRLCKEIVKAVDSDSPLLNEVAIALESTGVVSGEFGMAEAYERKRQEVLDWLSDPNEKAKAFAKRYVADLERMREAETRRAEEGLALRKHRFGGA